MTRIAVTGASGFVARHFIPMALAAGHEVRGLARHAPANATSHGGTVANFDFHTGDVRDAGAVRQLLEGCEIVVHLAASFSPDDDIPDIIVRGTDTVLAAAGEAGIGRFLMLSCLGAEASSPSPFMRAKWRAESQVRGGDIPFVLLRPSVIVGRDAPYIAALAALIRALPAVPVPGKGEHRQQPIDVDDVARCILTALTADNLTNEMVSVGGPMFLTIRLMIDLLSAQLGVFKPKVLVPEQLVGTAAKLLPPAARALFSEPRLAGLQHGIVASPGIVRREFGFEPIDIVPALASYLA